MIFHLRVFFFFSSALIRIRREQDKSVPQEALIRALKIYSPSEKASSCQLILQATHALLVASMQLCQADGGAAGDVRGKSEEEWGEAEVGVFWTCFLIEHMPIVRRLTISTFHS